MIVSSESSDLQRRASWSDVGSMSGSDDDGELSEEDGSRFWRTEGSIDDGGVSGAGTSWWMSSAVRVVSSSSSSVESSSRYLGLIGDHFAEMVGLGSGLCSI